MFSLVPRCRGLPRVAEVDLRPGVRSRSLRVLAAISAPWSQVSERRQLRQGSVAIGVGDGVAHLLGAVPVTRRYLCLAAGWRSGRAAAGDAAAS